MRRHAADGDSPLLEVEALSVEFHRSRDRSPIQVLDRLSFTIGSGEIVGLVGESGCGKSTLALALLRLLPPAGARTGGVIRFRGRDVESLSGAELSALRGSGMGLLPQESMSALHPTRTIGSQLDEAIHTHHPAGSTSAATRAAGRERALELLDLVALADPQRRLREFPHQLSGGERQRVALALALAAEPELLVADEPTSALDTTTQSRILDLFEALRERLGLSILLISHDLALVGERCERALVLYGGILLESGPLPALLEHPRHPYSRALLQTVPRLGDRHARGQLPVIAGTVHEPGETPRGCVFEPRCSERLSTCADERPAWRAISANEGVRCVLPTISEPSPPPPG